MIPLRPLQPEDAAAAQAVVLDAVATQAPGPYSPEQVRAWCLHVTTQADLPAALARGQGWASIAPSEGQESLEAFALRDPPDRLSLLYCRGRSCRQGRATALLRALEAAAAAEGVCRLRTEASQLSRPLLERQGWRVEAAEVVILAGVPFERWRMTKTLQRPLPDNGAVRSGGDG